jgi:S1-C subfamily serine protease
MTSLHHRPVVSPMTRTVPNRSSPGRVETVLGTIALASVSLLLLFAGLTAVDTGAGKGQDPSTTVLAAPVAAAVLSDVSDVAAQVVDSVVTVQSAVTTRAFGAAGQVTSSGSGVILDEAGTIVTNAHVVEDVEDMTVVLSNGERYAASVVGVDTGQDVAIISIDAADLTPIELGSTAGLLVGDPVIAVGNPLALAGGPSVSTGIVSALDRTLEDADVSLEGVIQTDAAITEGSSGGALLDEQGRLIGITTAVGVSSVGVEGIGFAIPVETIVQVMATLV